VVGEYDCPKTVTGANRRWRCQFVQQALGHSSKAFARAYSKKAKVIVPWLEDYEGKIVPLPLARLSQLERLFNYF
jgi:hypothetical protein